MIDYSLVDVKNISSNSSRSKFSEIELDHLADLILESGGIVRPLILKQSGVESYCVIEGDLEYFAAVRAKEKNPAEGEMVNAFIVSSKKEDIIKKQALALSNAIFADRQEEENRTTIESSSLSGAIALEDRLTNIELRIEKYINQFRDERAEEKRQLDARIKDLENYLTKKVNPLQVINTSDENELALKLGYAKIPTPEKLAKAIVSARQKKPLKKFENYSDVVKSIKGLGEKRMLAIIDDWSRTS
ncbi:MAG: chromosome partitioning protein ParB [Cyanothece sp. SIO1E1]|nr:chromosome partitioning protein ParB [Cyanothece sp. SIO1E1]